MALPERTRDARHPFAGDDAEASVTIVDVAREAGVSIRTVSRVLNREKYVSEQKRLQVQAVIGRLAFVPSAAARALPGARTYALGLIFQRLSANYMFDIQLAAVEACQSSGYHLVLAEINAQTLESRSATAAAVMNLRIDGAVILPPACDNIALLDALEKRGIRYTRLAPVAEPDRSPAITMDEEAATMTMVRHLFELGHRRIGFVVGNMRHASAQRRLKAFRVAVDLLGIARSDTCIEQGDYSYESGLDAARVMLNGATPPTAIFASNDLMAAGVIAAAGMRGLITPHDLSVCGFDDSPISRHIWPPLTTIRQPLTDMARSAVEQLLTPQRHNKLIRFDFTLITRASTTTPSQR